MVGVGRRIKTDLTYILIMNSTQFSNEMMARANEIVCDDSLNDFEKFDELAEVLYDEGYDLDDMTDFLLELSYFRIIA